MGMSGYVIPISAFVVGDYESAFEVVVRRMKIRDASRIGPDGVERVTPPRSLWGKIQRYSGLWALRRRIKRWRRARHRRDGRNYVRWLQDMLQQHTGLKMDWNEDGDMFAGHQIFSGTLSALVSFAYRVEFPEAFRKVAGYVKEDGQAVSMLDAVEERRCELKLQSQRFSHLCGSAELWVPVAFDPPQCIEDPAKADHPVESLRNTHVGSSIRLLDELMELNETLCIRERWAVPAFELPGHSDEPDELRGVHTGWLLMEGFAKASVEHRMPFCIDY